MSSWLIVNKDTKALHDGFLFDDLRKENCSIAPNQMWLEVPEGVSAGTVKVQENQDGSLSLVDSNTDKQGQSWDKMRAERNARLAACDWTMLADADLTKAEKDSWKAYRTELRNLPETVSDSENVVWPVKA